MKYLADRYLDRISYGQMEKVSFDPVVLPLALALGAGGVGAAKMFLRSPGEKLLRQMAAIKGVDTKLRKRALKFDPDSAKATSMDRLADAYTHWGRSSPDTILEFKQATRRAAERAGDPGLEKKLTRKVMKNLYAPDAYELAARAGLGGGAGYGLLEAGQALSNLI